MEVLGTFFSEHIFLGAIGAVSIMGLILMGIDKAAARLHIYRIPERVLMTFAALFGAAGVGLGMLLFHHKTRKLKFKWGVPILLIVQIAIVYFGYTTNWSRIFL